MDVQMRVHMLKSLGTRLTYALNIRNSSTLSHPSEEETNSTTVTESQQKLKT